MKSDIQAIRYGLIAVFLWSTVATAFKYSLTYLSPAQLVLYASLTSLIILLFISIKQNKLKLVYSYIKERYILIFLLGGINPFLYYLVLFKAYDLLPAQEAQAINYTWALMLAYLAVPFLKQKLTIKDFIAGVICYFGVLIISTKGDPLSLNFSNLEGVLFALLSTVLWAIYWIFNTKTKVDPVVGLFSNFLFATPLIVIYNLYMEPISLPAINGVLGAIYIGFFEMGVTFLFWLKAMQITTSTSKIANLIFISPFFSLIFIYFILDEQIYLSTIFGLVFIIVGLLVQKKR